MERIRWFYYDLQGFYRLLFPEQSVKDLIKCVGAFWLWRHGVRREVKIRLWSKGHGYYSADLARPRKKLIVEAKGGYRKYYGSDDIARDYQLTEKGWQVMRVTQKEIRDDPGRVKREVRRHLRG